jgi:hypothetical protein
MLLDRGYCPDWPGLGRIDSPPNLGHKRDIKQFRQACKEAGLTIQERYEASEVLHAEKQAGSVQASMSYGELLAWLRQWRG